MCYLTVRDVCINYIFFACHKQTDRGKQPTSKSKVKIFYFLFYFFSFIQIQLHNNWHNLLKQFIRIIRLILLNYFHQIERENDSFWKIQLFGWAYFLHPKNQAFTYHAYRLSLDFSVNPWTSLYLIETCVLKELIKKSRLLSPQKQL